MNRNKILLVDSIQEHSFLDSNLLELKGGKYEVPFETEPTKGNHSLENCESCRKQWQILFDELEKKFAKFPNCCDYHSKLNELDFFDKNDFKNIAKSTANKVMFTYHHVINNLDEENWYNDIIDYIQYNYESFGTFPEGYGEPFRWGYYCEAVLHLLNNIEAEITSTTISNVEVKIRLIKIRRLFEDVPDSEANIETDFNLLMSIYSRWYKIFPFELPYFNHLESKFKKTLPLFTGRTHHNKYLKATKVELHTKDSLTLVLLQITKNIVSSINGVSLFEKGLITNAEKHQIDLIVSNRKLQLQKLSAMPNANKHEYVKVLKKWFKEEKEFIKEIAPLLKTSSTPNGNSRPNRTDVAYYVHYMRETKMLKLDNPFPSDKAWKEIGKKFNKSPKNIQQAYNLINSDSKERLKKSKIKNLNYVIEDMLEQHKDALKLAKDELKTAQLNS